MAQLHFVPHLGTTDEELVFVAWHAALGSAVTPGTVLATVETLKAAFEIEAQVAGTLLRRLCEPGERIHANAAIAVLGEPNETIDPAWLTAELAKLTPAAPAARRRAAELGVNLADVAGGGAHGLVRVQDVEQAHAANRSNGSGTLDAEFVRLLRLDLASFGALRSELKLHLYRAHGAQIGNGCHFAAGAVLCANSIVLGNDAYFGAETVVEAGELRAGALLHFGNRCRVRGQRLVFGDNAFFADDLEIGGGGAMDPEAELLVGSHGFVGEHVHLNPCRTLRIGDEVVISRQAVLMTHSFGPSYLRGYPSRFAPVTVLDGAQIGIAAVLFPGVTIGTGAVVLSGSSVVTSVPAGRLVGGVPATDQKAAAQQLTAAELRLRAAELVREFCRQLQLRGRQAQVQESGEQLTVSVLTAAGAHYLSFAPDAAFAPLADSAAQEWVRVAVQFPESAGDNDLGEGTALAITNIALEPPRVRGPLGPLGAAWREFLRKRGVRLHPRTWAYRGGWL